MTVKRLTVALAVFAMVSAACSSDDSSDTASQAADTTSAPAEATDTTPAPTEAPDTTAPAEAADTTAAPPGADPVTIIGADGVESTVTDVSRVVSLNGDLTEIVFELGLGANVVAIDVTTTFPDEAAALPAVGFGQSLVAEPVLAFSPTVVIGDTQIGPPEAIEQIRSAGIPVVILETQTTLPGISTKIREVAQILGAEEQGEELVARVESEIADATALAATATGAPRAAFLYTRRPDVLLLFGNGTVTQALIEAAGGVDAAAESGINGVIPLTPEALVAAEPEVLITDSGGLSAIGGLDGFLALPGVAETPAGAEGNILDYDEAFFLGFGPRAGQALDELVRDLYPELNG